MFIIQSPGYVDPEGELEQCRKNGAHCTHMCTMHFFDQIVICTVYMVDLAENLLELRKAVVTPVKYSLASSLAEGDVCD